MKLKKFPVSMKQITELQLYVKESSDLIKQINLLLNKAELDSDYEYFYNSVLKYYNLFKEKTSVK